MHTPERDQAYIEFAETLDPHSERHAASDVGTDDLGFHAPESTEGVAA